tara:strand:- start:272 stop:463 length:192 start_codon:yes stop_codon:yes gene_type:complete
MTPIKINLATIPTENRYTILCDGKNSAVYKRYLHIFYVRVSRIFTEYEVWTEVVQEYDKLKNL